MIFFSSIYCVNVFWFNVQLAKKSYRWVLLFLCRKLVFRFLPFLNLEAQIRCPQNQYTDFKSALDQPMTCLSFWKLLTFSFKKLLMYRLKMFDTFSFSQELSSLYHSLTQKEKSDCLKCSVFGLNLLILFLSDALVL